MSTSDVYDCVVIGAGVQGSFTAYELAKRRKRTVLLEQVGRASVSVREKLIKKNFQREPRRFPLK